MKDYYKMEAGVTKYNKVHICIFEILAYTYRVSKKKNGASRALTPIFIKMGGGGSYF